MSQIERSADARPSAATLFSLANALGTSVAALLGNTEPDDGEGAELDIPDSLREFAEAEALPPADVRMLAQIRYRGEAPQTEEDWRFLYQSIRRSVNR